MAFDQTKDVLEHARKFHQQLSVFYDDLKSSTEKKRARALLDYMSSHEQYLDERLKKFGEEVSSNILDTYFKYGSEATKICEITDLLLGNCFLRGVLDGAVEGIGEGEKGGWLLLMRWGMKYRRFEFSEFTERVVPFLNVSDGRVTVVPATEYD